LSKDDFIQIAGFVRDNIDSVGQLEILLLLHAAGDQPRTAKQINETLRSSLSSVENRLQGLQNHGLVTAETESGVRVYRFMPRTPELRAHVDTVALVYSEYRGRMIDLICSPKNRLRDFSDAFRIKGEEDDDA
jgi:hypothetical protein